MILVHYYAFAEPYSKHDPAHANSEAVREYTTHLVRRGLIVPTPGSPSGYRTTPEGNSFVDALRSLGELA